MAALLKEFNIAAQSRDDELAILENGNFTSNEEDMGITPNQYNKQNSAKRARGQKKGSISSLE